MVSEKCTFQLSRSSTLARAAAIPPSAITVCALPRSDLQISPTLTPAADASIAARNPAPPAPMTITSCSCDSWLRFVRHFCWHSSNDQSITTNHTNHTKQHEKENLPRIYANDADKK